MNYKMFIYFVLFGGVVLSAAQMDCLHKESNEKKQTRLLSSAIKTEKLVWIQSVFDQGLDPNIIIDDQGRTPLMVAAMYGKAEVVRLLVGLRGLKFFVVNSEGHDAFNLANRAGHQACAELIWQAMEKQSKDFDNDNLQEPLSDQGDSDDSPPLAPRNNSQVPSRIDIRSADSTRNL